MPGSVFVASLIEALLELLAEGIRNPSVTTKLHMRQAVINNMLLDRYTSGMWGC